MTTRRKVLLFSLTGILLVVALSFICFAPPLREAATYPGGTILRDDAGRILRVSLGAGDVDCRPYYAASEDDWIVKALIASEDGRFYDHHGVDFLSVARALFQNIFYMRRISGASTITMQATRLIAPHPRSYVCKYKQAFRAIRLDFAKDKMWIISQYLNRAPFGSNLIGIEAAANGWFGKRAKDLAISEAALLAGMVQAPSRFRPDRNLARALKRRRYVLERMLKHGMITEQQFDGADKTIPTIRRGIRPFEEPFFCDTVQAYLNARTANGTAEQYGDYETTLNMDIQEHAKRLVSDASRGYSVAVVVMRADTGAIVSLACSGDYFSKDAGQVNTATAPRSAGSTLKTFLTAAAIDRGLLTPQERLTDERRAYHWYNPANFDAAYRGRVTVSDALVMSLNIPFLRILERFGVTRFGTLLRSLGCAQMNELDTSYGLGMAIGNVEVTLLELVSAYGALARGGVYLPPTLLKKEVGTVPGGVRIFSEGASWMVSDILSGEQRAAAAVGHLATVRLPRFAWKTGTSAAYKDAWTVAWNPEYVIGVWCGHKEGFMGNEALVGANAAAPLAWQMARFLYPSGTGPWYSRPEEVVERTVCSVSGKRASGDCPQTEIGLAIRDVTSTEICPLHRRMQGGRVIQRDDAQKLAISSPENNSTYYLVPGIDRQRIVCKVVGHPEHERLWWFVDGERKGVTEGTNPFVWEPTLGPHKITCTTRDGKTASVHITIQPPEI